MKAIEETEKETRRKEKIIEELKVDVGMLTKND